MLAAHHQFAALVVDCRAHDDHAGGATRDEFDDLQRRIDGVAREHAGEKLRRLLQERDQRVRHFVREAAGAGRREADDLQSVREQARIAACRAVFGVVVDRVVVAGDDLERGEIRVRHGAARQHVALADREIVEPALRWNVGVFGVDRYRWCL